MSARRLTRILDAIERASDRHLPMASFVVAAVVLIVCSLCLAGSTWPPLPQPEGSAPSITLTPDDPAASAPVPAQVLDR
ncbi:hypothetical protein [Kutzneria buriramensis]|uniref:Uncharacterized protein n=1 Tax=Kutzneria buriramensis TaxID=1045776 RepID=A0A3E0HEG5_9PSEU|nr:hypothetical protein [Kutzneria buriramensis]REH43664.1 hypothetical protein BCF44_109207 [Kutzneria buriramensis]